MKLSILLVKILFVPLTGFLIGKCISRAPRQEDVLAGEPLPIDGVWKTTITSAKTDHDFYFKIDHGRMYLADVQGPDSLNFSEDIGKLFFCDIKSLGKNKYACKIFTIYGKPAIDGYLEVVNNKLFISPRSPILLQELSRVSLTNDVNYHSGYAK